MIYDDVPGRDNLLKWMERHLQYNTWIKTRKQTGNCYMMLYGNHETCRNHEKLGHCIAHTFAKYSIVPVKVNKYYMEMWWNVVCVCLFSLTCLPCNCSSTLETADMQRFKNRPWLRWDVSHVQSGRWFHPISKNIYACQSESSPHIPKSIYWICVSMFSMFDS